MSGRQYGLGFGLTIQTDMALPGMCRLPVTDPLIATGSDIEITGGQPKTGRSEVELGPYRVVQGKLLFEVRDTACFTCTEHSIRVAQDSKADAGTVSGLLVATALPAVLWMRGEIILHAAAAQLPGAAGAVAIAGASGSGKSTILDQLCSAGARMVADDSLCVRMTGSGVEGSGLPGGYFLGRPDTNAREFRAVPETKQRMTAPIAAILILAEPRSGSSAELERLRGIDALEALLVHRHRPRIPALLGLEKTNLAALVRLTERVPIYRWHRRKGSVALDECEMALCSWREDGSPKTA